MGIKDICNHVLYSYSVHTCQFISYLTGPQFPLDIYFLSGPHFRLECLCICAHEQMALRDFNKEQL